MSQVPLPKPPEKPDDLPQWAQDLIKQLKQNLEDLDRRVRSLEDE
jgi:hypothetical protein